MGGSVLLEAPFSEPAACRSAAAERKLAHSHPLWQCQLRTFKRSLRDAGRGTTTLSVFPKAQQHSLPHPKSSISVPPQTILLFGSSVHGTMREAAGGLAVTSRSSPAPDGEGVGGPTCSPGFPTTGRAHPAGYAGGALGSVAATLTPAAGALPAQRRSDARLCPRLAILALLLLLLLQLLVLLLLLLAPSAAAPAAGSSSPSLPLSLSTRSPVANFPVPGRAAQSFPCSLGPTADRGLPARLCLVSHLCALACSGENRTMPRDGDRGAARARWLGTGLLGKAVPAWSLLLPLCPRYPLPRGGGT